MTIQKFPLPSPQLVIIGHVAYDQTTQSSGEQSHFFPSGAAYFSAVGASLYNKNIGIVSRVGADYDLHLLTRLSIDLEGVKRIPDSKTTRFYFIYKTPTSTERTFRSEFNVNTDLSPSDIPLRYLTANHIHIAPMPPQKQRLFVEFLKKKSNATLSLDTIEQFVEQWPQKIADVMQQVDIVFMNSREYATLKRHHGDCVFSGKHIILKDGARGAVYIHKTTRIAVPAPMIHPIVDKSGAGDVLAGVFLALLAQGKQTRDALQTAVNTASQTLSGHGVEMLLKA